MPVIPQFQPAAPALAPAEAMQSWMGQAQERQLRQQQIEKNQMDLSILRPVLAARQQAEALGVAADIATAKAKLTNDAITNVTRVRYATESAQAQKDFLDAHAIPGWDEQANALSNLQQKYSWMSVLPEAKGFMASLDSARANAEMRGRVDTQNEQMQALTQARVDEALQAAQIRADAEAQRAQIASDAAAMRDQAMMEREQFQQQAIARRETLSQATKQWQTRQQVRTKAWTELAKAAAAGPAGTKIPELTIEEMPDPFAEQGGPTVSIDTTSSVERPATAQPTTASTPAAPAKESAPKMAKAPDGTTANANPLTVDQAIQLPSGTWFMGTDNQWHKRK